MSSVDGAVSATPAGGTLPLKRERSDVVRKRRSKRRKRVGETTNVPLGSHDAALGGAKRREGGSIEDPSPFGKNLAHTDKKVRDKAFRSLATWLRHKDLDSLGWLKLWKGLFYCFWMSDKPAVQQQLAVDLAGLTCKLKRESAWQYVRYFWETLCREWPGIDRLRLDKYYMLMRKFLKQSFVTLSESKWFDDDMCRFVDIMTSVPLSPDRTDIPDSIRYQVSDIFIEELENAITGKNLSSVQTSRLLDPFISLLAGTNSKTVMDRVRENVLEAAAKRSASAEIDGQLPIYDVQVLAAAVSLRAADESTPVVNRRRMEKIAEEFLKMSPILR